MLRFPRPTKTADGSDADGGLAQLSDGHQPERSWKDEAKLRGEMEKLREALAEYAKALAEMAGVQL